MKCIILAGGFATRLWPLTENKAKPLLHLKDKPLISHLADQIPIGIEIIVSTNRIFEQAFEKWKAGYPNRPITIFVEDSKTDEGKKGALAATALVIEEFKIKEDLLLIAGDNYFGFDMKDFIATYDNKPLVAAYDIGSREAARTFGVVVTNDNNVMEFQEKPENPKSSLVSTGCYLFPVRSLTDIVHYSREHNDDLGGVFEHFIKIGEIVRVFEFNEPWFDIGSFRSYIDANKKLIGNNVIQRDNVILDDNSRLEGSVYLGNNVKVINSILSDTIILDNCEIYNCVIRTSIVDENSHLKNIDLEAKMIRHDSDIRK